MELTIPQLIEILSPTAKLLIVLSRVPLAVKIILFLPRVASPPCPVG
ncbi:MAG: hypothetical protein ACLSVG_10180 [Clostridia bacterium]